MRKEIEKKFLLNEFPSIRCAKKFHILQGYISVDEDKEIRVKRIFNKGDYSYILTVKTLDSFIRDSYEISLTYEQFTEMWKAVKYFLRKVMYSLIIGKFRYEISVYNNFSIVEIEFSSVEEANNFKPPEWLGKEVSSKDKFMNRNIAKYFNYM